MHKFLQRRACSSVAPLAISVIALRGSVPHLFPVAILISFIVLWSPISSPVWPTPQLTERALSAAAPGTPNPTSIDARAADARHLLRLHFHINPVGPPDAGS